MVTTREWWRQGLRAWSASAIVPVAVLVAVAVLAIGGGVGGVQRLGQLFSGPAVPSPVQAAGRVDVRTERHAALPHIPARVMAGAAVATRAVRSAPVHAAPRRHAGAAPHARFTPPAHQSPGSAKPIQTKPPPQKPVTTTPPPPPPPPPPSPKTITRRVGDTVNKVVAPLPIVGPTASKAIDTVVTTVDKVLPLPPPTQLVNGLLGQGAK
jgi:hypothetical protein